MNQAMMTISALCMTAAVCTQLMQKNRFGKAVRLLLGFEIARVMLELAQKAMKDMFLWS